MKIILEFEGDREEFKKAFNSMDGQFDIADTIFCELDYSLDTEIGLHITEYGNIAIRIKD